MYLWKTRAGKLHQWLPWRHRLRRAAFSKCFPSTLNAKPAFSNSSGLKSVIENLRFRDGLVWTVTEKERKLSVCFPVETKEQHRCQQTDLYPTPGVFYQATVKCHQSMDQRNPLAPRDLWNTTRKVFSIKLDPLLNSNSVMLNSTLYPTQAYFPNTIGFSKSVSNSLIFRTTFSFPWHKINPVVYLTPNHART